MVWRLKGWLLAHPDVATKTLKNAVSDGVHS
jgi:hypothetical protein